MTSVIPAEKGFKCPVCGSNKGHVTSESKSYPVPYGPLTILEEQYTSCDNCGEKVSISDRKYSEAAITASKWESAKTMITYLCNLGHSCAGIERVLELPQRTLSQWRSSHEPAAGGLALLRLIRTYPWLLEVAADGYTSFAAKQTLFNAAMKQIGDSLSAETNCMNFERSAAAIVERSDGERQALFVGVYNDEKQQTVTDGNLQMIESQP